MEDFTISRTTIWLLALSNLVITITGITLRLNDAHIHDSFIYLGATLSLTTWVIIVRDMIFNTIYNKRFWIISMFILPHVSAVIYLFQRDRLKRLGERFN